MHDSAGAPSRLQANVEPDSLELNSKVASVEPVDAGGAVVIVVSGGVVSVGGAPSRSSRL